MISFRSFVTVPYSVAHLPTNSTDSTGGWITPRGGIEIFPPNVYHITDLTSHPSKFGMSAAEVLATYSSSEYLGRDAEGRPVIGDEERGAAVRARLLAKVFRRGWIRYRRMSGHWEIELYALSNRSKNAVAAWAESMIGRGISDRERVTIIRHDGRGSTSRYDLRSLAGFAHIDEHRKVA